MRPGTSWRVAALVAVAAAGWTARAEDPSPFEGTWDLRLVYKNQKPDTEKARLVLANAAGSWSGTLAFERQFNGNKQPLTDVVVQGSSIRFGVGQQDLRMEGTLERAVLTGRWVGKSYDGSDFAIPWSATRLIVEPVERFEKGLSFEGWLPQAHAEDLGMDGAALDELVRDASHGDTDALVVIRDGKVVAERYFGHADAGKLLPAPTTFVTAFAAALLVEDGKIASFEAPVSTWFADWKDGRKGKVTVRHLLTHTSGIDLLDDAKLRAAKDAVALVRGQPLGEVPGTTWKADNHSATQLLCGVLGQAAGRSVDAYLRERLFTPLGIRKLDWKRDGAGNTIAWEGLAMTARDLARIGKLVAEDGEVGTTKVIAPASITALSTPASPAAETQGLLWELHCDYPKTPPTGIVGRAAFGQWIVVFPKTQTVGIRLRARKNAKSDAADAAPEVLFAEFPIRLANAAR